MKKININMKHIIVVLLIASLALNIFLIFDRSKLIDIDKQHEVNRYIKYTLSSEFELLFTLLDNLNTDFINNDVIKISGDKALGKIRNVNYKILLIDTSMQKLIKLNKSYDISIKELHRYLFGLESMLINGKEIAEEDIARLSNIKALSAKYRIIGNLNLYKDRDEVMRVPHEVLDYLKELRDIVK